MKTDINGTSTTARGQEQHERYYSPALRGWRIQYDYRTPSGKLFSCIAKSVEDARGRRDKWLQAQEPTP